ncbi:DUF4255 domain-containing protein [Myxococcota bacterium]|nr:DUF4255 domain-containing protein [Myxococcota bacterium]
MGNVRSIAAVSRAVVTLLEANYDRTLFDNDLEFDVYTGRDFQAPMTAGVTVFIYRVFHNGTNRLPPGRVGADGRRQRTRLPVDLHFILTAWAPTASLQHTIVAWMMRVLEDHPLLPAGFLNHAEPGAFQADELVEIAPVELSTEDLLGLWERLVGQRYVLSVPYVARTVMIDSSLAEAAGPDVVERVMALREIVRRTP